MIRNNDSGDKAVTFCGHTDGGGLFVAQRPAGRTYAVEEDGPQNFLDFKSGMKVNSP